MKPEIWHVPVRIDDIPEDGRRYELNPDLETRAALARLAGVDEVRQLHADFDVRRHGAGLRVAGVVSGKVRQTCVVTLDPLDNKVEEVVDLVFLPRNARAPAAEVDLVADGTSPEPLAGATVDLGAIATEFLILGVDPYPRRPGAVFAPPAGDEANSKKNPFAALAQLKKDGKSR
jgi:hypothetical protein